VAKNRLTPSDPQKSVLVRVAAWAAGFGLSTYFGMILIIPALAGAAIWYCGRKLVTPVQPRYLAAIALLGAHLFWQVAGQALIGPLSTATMPLDVFVFTGGLIWLWVRPGIWPVFLLTVFQVFVVDQNVFSILDHPVGSTFHKAMTLHILLRVLEVGAMWYAFIATRREQRHAFQHG
jgi:hypothetical protein